MWVMLPSGAFVSIVQKPEDRGRGTLCVRARIKADLEDFGQLAGKPVDIVGGVGTDYAWRATVEREDVAAAMASAARSIDYSNYKGHVSSAKGAARVHVLHEIWASLFRLQRQ